MAKKVIRGDKGDGTLRMKENGSFEYRFIYTDEFGNKKRKSFTGFDEDICYEKAEMFLAQVDRKIRGIEVDATIPDILRKRFKSDFDKNYVGEQGYDRNMANLRIIEKGVLGRMPIADITPGHIDVFLMQITKYSNSVIGKVYMQLRIAFAVAVEKEIIKKNIMLSRDLKCPKSNKPDKKVRAYTEEEQEILIKDLYEHKVPYGRNSYKLQIFIELFSGMRMGEINALKPENIDFEKKLIHIRATISRGIGCRPFVKEGTKTYAGMRDIPISNLLKPVLIEALENMKENPYGLIFYDHKAKSIIETTQVNNFFRRLCEKCGLEFNGQHALRHTYATRCIEAGIQPVVLKKWLGHKNIHVTLDTYADVFDRMNDNAVEQLEEYIGNMEEKFGSLKEAI